MAQRSNVASVTSVARTLEGHTLLRNGARAGYALNGVLHLLIAWIALQIAWSGSGKSADPSGALRSLAASGAGELALWATALGFLALGVWQLASAVALRTRGKSSRWVEKAKGIAKAVIYLALAWTSFSFAQGQPSSSKAQSTGFTDNMLQQGHGRLLVASIGLVIIGVGGYHVAKGWTRRFLKDLTRNPGVQVTRAGVVGYIAKGIALAMVGLLFVTAAVQNSSSGATGLDGALRSLLQDAVGPWLLTAVGLGLGAYGVYSFARSGHARF